MNRELPVLEAARGLDSWRRPKGSRPLETRMATGLHVVLLNRDCVKHQQFIQDLLKQNYEETLEREMQKNVLLLRIPEHNTNWSKHRMKFRNV